MNSKNKTLSTDELLAYIDKLEKEIKNNKKYGLIWDKEDTPEDIVLKCKNNIPVLNIDDTKTLKHGIDNNILIEGDNFHALTTLNYILQNSIDIIYIDPPYNTGNKDFIYNDKFVDTEDGYKHSKWLNFMSKRLKLARNLMKEKSLIFISIDDREYAQLKLLCDSIFGENNFIANLKWKKKKQPSFLSNVAGILEYVLVYAKKGNLIKKLSVEQLKDSDKPIINAGNIPSERIFKAGTRAKCKEIFIKAGTYKNKSQSITYLDDVHIENGKTTNKFRCVAPFRTSQDLLDKYGEEGLIFITSNLGLRRDLSVEERGSAKSITDLLLDWGQNQDGSNTLKDIFNITNSSVPFSNPKPVQLIYNCVKSSMFSNPVVLDFFAGSGTTGQAVLELNKEDGGHRKFILCTNNENNICTDVCYPRLKTVITGIRQDGSKYSDGIPANLYYFKTDFVKDEKNRDQAKYSLVEKCNGLLCILEDCYDLVESHDAWYEYSSPEKELFIFNDFYSSEAFENMKSKIKQLNKTCIVYVFSTDENLDFVDLTGIENVTIKPIPTKIYEIYKEIVEDIKRGE